MLTKATPSPWPLQVQPCHGHDVPMVCNAPPLLPWTQPPCHQVTQSMMQSTMPHIHYLTSNTNKRCSLHPTRAPWPLDPHTSALRAPAPHNLVNPMPPVQCSMVIHASPWCRQVVQVERGVHLEKLSLLRVRSESARNCDDSRTSS